MAKIINLDKKFWQWAVLIFLSLLWGTSFILMKKGLNSFSGMQLGAMRVFFAFLSLLPFIFSKFKKLRKKDLKPLLLVGFLGNFFPAFLFAIAQTKVSSSLAGMLNTAFPLLVILVGITLYKTGVKRNELLGVSVGIIGSLGLIFGGSLDFFSDNYMFLGFIVLAMIFYAISLNEIKFNLSHLDGFTVSVFAFVLVGPFAGGYLLFSDFSVALATPDYKVNLLYIVILAISSSTIAVSIFYIFIEKVDVIFASLVTYLIPIVAILWGLFDGEKISILQIISMVVILLGVYIVNRTNSKINSEESKNI